MNSRLLVLAIALVVLGTGPATGLAGECQDTTRKMGFFDDWLPSAHTTVKNETAARNILVEIYREETKKTSKYIDPGESASFNAKFAETGGGATFYVEGLPDPGRHNFWCKYRVRYTTKDKLVWQLVDDMTEACQSGPELRVTCSKSFHKDKLKYQTTIKVYDTD